MTEQFEKFVKVLREMFMIDDAADLDFGIYKVMHQKQADIEKYLNEDLQKNVQDEIVQNVGGRRRFVEEELQKAKQGALSLGVPMRDIMNVPRVKALAEELEGLTPTDELENMTYDHLARFFSRYYDDGDFISKRRYSSVHDDNKYAIPYGGEEVMMYWANQDQYYIKSSEYLKNYSFKLDGDKKVVFRVVNATQEEIGNNKADEDMIRCFALADSDDEDFIFAEGNVLTIRFTYELMKKERDLQDKLINTAGIKISERVNAGFSTFNALMYHSKPGIDDSPSVLQKHLKAFVKRNTCDFFIHKNLKRFLERELDFYIKNEILHIDDIDTSEHRIRSYVTLVKTVKHVGYNIIAFLAGIENFQKKLWLKKKFVTESNFCITLDRVDKGFYEEIASNEKQRKEWVRLYSIDSLQPDLEHPHAYSVPLSIEYLKENPYLLLDTKFYSEQFKHRLKSSITDFDQLCDGVLVHSDNMQALSLLNTKFKGQYGCVYIDPPYNTDTDDFDYKDSFKHSSWLCMMGERLMRVRNDMKETGAIFINIDDNEYAPLKFLCDMIFGSENFVANVIWKHTQQSKNDEPHFSRQYNYLLIYAKNINSLDKFFLERTDDNNKNYSNPDHDVKGAWRSGDVRSPHYRASLCFPITAPNGNVIQPPANGWRWSKESIEYKIKTGEIIFKSDNTGIIRKIYLADQEGRTPENLWEGERFGTTRSATAMLKNLFGYQPFDTPKPVELVERIMELCPSEIVIDFFGGSGTTAHSVININKRDDINRKYILVDVEKHFDSLMKPRIQKIIYSKDWRDGKPVSRQGISHCFKYITLEQYEDTLNNLVVKSNNGGLFGTYSESYLGYMLDFETRDSLFSIEKFDKPFDYKMQITRRNETSEQTIDLVETFNYLLGLYVEHEEWPDENLCIVKGTTRDGERTLIIWRNVAEVDSEKLNTIFAGMEDKSFDRIYVNGDNNLENLRTDADIWKVSLTEETFKHKMFTEE